MDIKVVKHWYFPLMLSKINIEEKKIIVPALGLEEIHLPEKMSRRKANHEPY